jgi:hypothetical protein
MVCQLWLLVISLCLNNPRRVGFTRVKSRIKKMQRRQQGTCRCKIAGTGYHSVVANCAQMCTADCHKKVILPLIATKKIIIQRIATKTIIVPQIAIVKSLHLRADSQWAIRVVANRGTLENGLPKGYSCRGKPRLATKE